MHPLWPLAHSRCLDGTPSFTFQWRQAPPGKFSEGGARGGPQWCLVRWKSIDGRMSQWLGVETMGRQGLWREPLQDAKVSWRIKEYKAMRPENDSQDTVSRIWCSKESCWPPKHTESYSCYPSFLQLLWWGWNVFLFLYFFPSNISHFFLRHLVPPELEVYFCNVALTA